MAAEPSPREWEESQHQKPTSLQLMLDSFNRAYLQAKSMQNAAKQIVTSPETRHKINEKLERVTGTPFIKTKDKFSFVLGVFLVIVLEYVIIKTPELFGKVYLSLAFPLLSWRFYGYRKKKMHYFMLDYCYFVQLFAVYFVLFCPDDRAFFKLFFGLSNGPLLGAVILWQNRLVFHDSDKITSLFIHIVPPLLSYCVRWSDKQLWEGSTEYENTITMKDIGVMMLFYVLWQVLYLFKTAVMDKEKLDMDPELITSARWLTMRSPHPIYKIFKKHGIENGQVALASFQLVFTFFTLLTVSYMYQYHFLHQLALISAFFAAAWYGASYYFEEFAARYTQALEKRLMQAKTRDAGKRAHRALKRRSLLLFLVYMVLCAVCIWALLSVTIWKNK